MVWLGRADRVSCVGKRMFLEKKKTVLGNDVLCCRPCHVVRRVRLRLNCCQVCRDTQKKHDTTEKRKTTTKQIRNL